MSAYAMPPATPEIVAMQERSATAIRDALARHAAQEEAAIRHMLGQWQSELEPQVLRGPNLQIVGLTIEGLSIGQEAPVVVANPWYRERHIWNPSPERAEFA